MVLRFATDPDPLISAARRRVVADGIGASVEGGSAVGEERPIVFSGDLADPWARAIRSALPKAEVLDGPTLPDPWPERFEPATLILHRATLTAAEIERIRGLKQDAEGPRVLLVVGPHVRHHQLQRLGTAVDVVVSEAMARETIARHLAAAEDEPAPRLKHRRPAVAVACRPIELAEVLTETCQAAGHPATVRRFDLEDAPEPWRIWEVPTLELDWPNRLAKLARGRTLIALIGLADREAVEEARRRGAAACLDLPCEPADLRFVLDRLVGGRGERIDPPAGDGIRRAGRRPRKRRSVADRR